MESDEEEKQWRNDIARYESEQLMRINKLRDKVQDQIYMELYKQCVYNRLSHKHGPGWLQGPYDQMEQIRKGDDIGTLWVTVNPQDFGEGTPVALAPAVEDLCRKKFVQAARWTYEQRGETEETRGTGVHVHLLLYLKENRGRLDSVKRSIKSVFQHLCGNPKHIDIRTVPDGRINDKIDYLAGKKWDEEKDGKIEQDKLWRESINLQETYNYICDE